MRKLTKLLEIGVLAMFLGLSGCGDDNGGGPTEPGPFNALTLDFYDMTPLGSGFVYRLWAVPSAEALSAAPTADWTWLVDFNVSPGGDGQPMVLTTPEGQAVSDNRLVNLSEDLEEYDSLFVTIEQVGSSTETPSATILHGGAIPDVLEHGETSAFEFAPDAAVGLENFFLLATPTDDLEDNDTSGVWFTRGIAPFSQGLSLDEAPAGWLYEGWVWHDTIWLSTGKFSDPGAADNFAGYSGIANPSPGFPGEDFLDIDNAPAGTSFPWVMELGDSVAVTLEPDPDPAIGQFGARLLHSTISGSVRVRTSYFMGVALDFPSAVIVFWRSDVL